MKRKTDENRKVTLTIGQLKRLVRESDDSLGDDEREALYVFVATVIGDLGTDEEFERYSDLRKSLSDDEMERLKNLADLFDDTINYDVVDKDIIGDDLPVLRKVLKWADENDMMTDEDGDFNWDLVDAYERICEEA